MKANFFLVLVLQVFATVAVVGIFRLIENRFHAGLVAGSLFVALGVFVVTMGVRNSSFRRSLTFVLGCVHLAVIALPMILFRIVNADVEFPQVKVWGLPGPTFHRLSEGLFLLWMLSALIEGGLSWWRAKTPSKQR